MPKITGFAQPTTGVVLSIAKYPDISYTFCSFIIVGYGSGMQDCFNSTFLTVTGIKVKVVTQVPAQINNEIVIVNKNPTAGDISVFAGSLFRISPKASAIIDSKFNVDIIYKGSLSNNVEIKTSFSWIIVDMYNLLSLKIPVIPKQTKVFLDFGEAWELTYDLYNKINKKLFSTTYSKSSNMAVYDDEYMYANRFIVDNTNIRRDIKNQIGEDVHLSNNDASQLPKGTYTVQYTDEKTGIKSNIQTFDYEFDTSRRYSTWANGFEKIAVQAAKYKPDSDFCKTPAAIAATPFAGGKGTSAEPYLICTPEQLFKIPTASYYNFKLMTNIDLNAFPNRMISNTCLQGIYFNGDGYKISNFIFNNSNIDNVGLFSCLSSSTIENLILFTPFVTGRDNVSFVVGNVKNSSVSFNNIQVIGLTDIKANLKGRSYVAGLIAKNDYGYSVFSNIFMNNVNIEGNGNYISGVSIEDYSSIFKNISLINTNVHATQPLIPNNGDHINGIAHIGDLFNVTYSGSVSGSTNVSGLSAQGRIHSSVFRGSVFGAGNNVAGLINLSGYIEKSIFAGTVRGARNVYGISASNGYYCEGYFNNNLFDGTISTIEAGAPWWVFHNEVSCPSYRQYWQFNNRYNKDKFMGAAVNVVGTKPSDYGIVGYSVGSTSATLIAEVDAVPEYVPNTWSGEVAVSGASVGYYRYKLAPPGTTNVCTDISGYTTERPIAEKIKISVPYMLSLYPSSTQFVLCVIGSNWAGQYQSLTTPTQAKFQLGVPPAAAVLTGVPTGVNNILTVNIQVAGANITHYQYQIGRSDLIDCNDLGDYSVARPVSTKITDTLTNFVMASIKLCVRGRTAGGVYQLTPTVAYWTLDTQPPVLSVSGLPNGVSKQTSIVANVAGVGVVKYKYKFGFGDALICTAATPAWSAILPVSTPISQNLSLPPYTLDGDLKLCVIGLDNANNASTIFERIWKKDTIPPVAALSDAPPFWSNLKVLNIKVGGTDVIQYSYKLGSDASTDCAVSTPASPYGELTTMDIRITQNIASMPDGLIKLCVVGKDLAGNLMPYAKATSYKWYKDTVAPIARISGAPAAFSKFTSLNIQIGSPLGADADDQVMFYSYKLGAVDDTFDCDINDVTSPYSSFIATTTPIATDISSYPDGTLRLCVVGKDRAGNIKPFIYATTYDWTKGNPPTIPLVRVFDKTTQKHYQCVDAAAGKTNSAPEIACDIVKSDTNFTIENIIEHVSTAPGQEVGVERIPLYACSSQVGSRFFPSYGSTLWDISFLSTDKDCEVMTRGQIVDIDFMHSSTQIGYIYPPNAPFQTNYISLYRCDRSTASMRESLFMRFKENCDALKGTATLLGYTTPMVQ